MWDLSDTDGGYILGRVVVRCGRFFDCAAWRIIFEEVDGLA